MGGVCFYVCFFPGGIVYVEVFQVLILQEAEEVLYKFLSFVLGRVDWARKYIANSFD